MSSVRGYVRTSSVLFVLLAATVLGSGSVMPPSAHADPTFAAQAVPVVSGVPQQGGALTVVAGAYTQSPDGFDYQWYAGGEPVGTSTFLYRPSATDVGKPISVTVTAHLAGEPDVVTESAPTAVVLNGGRVTGWGENLGGEVDDQPDDLGDQEVTAVAVGAAHFLALTSGGEIVGWGLDQAGQLDVPGELSGDTVVDVAAGWAHSMALTADGHVVAWGADADGSVADTADSVQDQLVVDVTAGSMQSAALSADGRLTMWGRNDEGQAEVPASLDGQTVVAVAPGALHTVALTSDGRVTAWGNGDVGQTEVPASLDDEMVVAVAAGVGHSIALTADGQAVTWGYEQTGELAVPDSLDGTRVVAVAAGPYQSLALTSAGELVVWGFDAKPQASLPPGLSGRYVSAIGASLYDDVALTPTLSALAEPVVSGVPQQGAPLTVVAGAYTEPPDGFHYQWYADGEPVGSDTFVHRPTAAEVGSTITVEVTAQLAGDPDATTTAAASGAVAGGGHVSVWGSNNSGENEVPAEVADQTLVQVATGEAHVLGITDEGAVVAWGNNLSGQTDVPDSLSEATVVAVAARNAQSWAVAADGTLTGWGGGITSPPDTLTDEDVVAVAAGSQHVLALTSDGRVIAWGADNHGQVDVPDSLTGATVVAIAAGGGSSVALTSDGRVTAWGSNASGERDVPASLADQTVVAIATGAHVLALTSDGRVSAWGSNVDGESDVPASLDDETVRAIAAGTQHSVVLTAEGELVTWGSSFDGETDLPEGLTGVTSIAAGNAHSAAIWNVAAFTSGPTPTIAGTPRVGEELTADPGTVTPEPDDLAYQWAADGEPVDGATGASYTPTPDQVGAVLSVEVTATRSGFADASGSSDPTDPVAKGVFTIAAPSVTGTVQVGQTLTCDSDEPDPTFAWTSDGEPVGDQAAYAIAAADQGRVLGCTVTVSRDGYEDATARTDVGPVGAAPADPFSVTVSGRPVVGSTLRAAVSDLAPSAVVSWQWLRDGKVVAGATGPTYRLGLGDHGHRFRARATVTDVGHLPGVARSEATDEVAMPPLKLTVTPDRVRIGNRIEITVTNLVPGEEWTLGFGNGDWSVTGNAPAGGDSVNRKVRIPESIVNAGKRRLVVETRNPGREDSVVITLLD